MAISLRLATNSFLNGLSDMLIIAPRVVAAARHGSLDYISAGGEFKLADSAGKVRLFGVSGPDTGLLCDTCYTHRGQRRILRRSVVKDDRLDRFLG